MRLWHYKLIEYLPKSQLLAQWRELNSIFKKENKHILINYVYDYDKIYLWNYSFIIMEEMTIRKIKLNKNSKENFKQYFKSLQNFYNYTGEEMFEEHNNEYLTICYYNLKEKYIRGQKDFTKEVWEKLDNVYKQIIKE